MHRLLSLQSVARGADGVMQFQWRQSLAGAEKFHSGMLPHSGENTRVFRETVELGAELESLAPVVGSRLRAEAAILFDWDSWWALEQAATPAQLSYVTTVFRWYRALWWRGILVDFVHPQADFSAYRLLVAPAAVVLPRDARISLAEYVSGGGHLVVGYQSGILDENLHVIPDGYLGELRDVLGIRIEEFAPPAAPSLSGGEVPALSIVGLGGGAAHDWGEVVDAASAEVLARFSGGMLDGHPAITRDEHGEGVAWYIATAPDELESVVEAVVAPVFPNLPSAPPADVEIVERGGIRFVLNHSEVEVDVDGVTIAPRGARVTETGAPG